MHTFPTLMLLSLALLAISSAQMIPKTVPLDIAAAYNAKCLNGDHPTYLIRRNKSSTKWILFLEGGGWCYGVDAKSTIASCAARGGFTPPSASDLNRHESSTAFTNGVVDYGGILGANSSTNPDFYTWNAVFIHYCDGASFGSNRVAPIAVKNKQGQEAQMWMRGRSNFDAVVQDLLVNEHMSNATEVILSGGSAGGLAVYYNLDHLAHDLLSKNVRVTGFPDAGFFMDAPNYVEDFQGADAVWNVTGSSGTNQNCLDSYIGEEYKCLLAPYLLEHIETSIYVMNSAYDAWQLGNNKVGCFPVPNTTCANDTSVMLYGAALKARVKNSLKNKANRFKNVSSKSGAYIDSCYVHEQNVNYCSGQGMPNCVGWTPSESGSVKWGYRTAIRNFTPQQAFSEFYFSHGNSKNSVLIDENEVQENKNCVYEGHPVLEGSV